MKKSTKATGIKSSAKVAKTGDITVEWCEKQIVAHRQMIATYQQMLKEMRSEQPDK